MLFSVAGHCPGLHLLSLPPATLNWKGDGSAIGTMVAKVQSISSLQSPGISNRVRVNLDTESAVPSSPYRSHWYFCPFYLPPGDLFLNIVKLIVAHFFSKEKWKDSTKAKSPECRRIHGSGMNSGVNKGTGPPLSRCWRWSMLLRCRLDAIALWIRHLAPSSSSLKIQPELCL